ncbi:hypothetical protein AB205_0115790 [Aquarana catesbeiana]|uniref:Uncharacterized protein n=1 Tax=Aquarana catesbeiana TaxID=8400 RepID=A0A2G9QCB2_AQUCT|nr:hypothetical protein AB205_0115790 [Aquarana catesbeiana]
MFDQEKKRKRQCSPRHQEVPDFSLNSGIFLFLKLDVRDRKTLKTHKLSLFCYPHICRYAYI